MSAEPVMFPGERRNPKGIGIVNDHGFVPPPDDKRDISKTTDEAVWVSLDGNAFTVIFENGSPFKKDQFHVPANGTAHSEEVVNGQVGDVFKYSVKGPAGKTDPTVIINR